MSRTLAKEQVRIELE